MKRWQKCGTALAAVTLAVGGGAAWADDGTPPRSPQNTTATAADAAPAAVHDTAVESRYTAIAPCRIVDTRKAGGKLGAGSSRSFIAAGTSGFTGQGGNSTGCGIPDAATSINVTITANSAGGRGYLKAYPDNLSSPTATFMNYTSSYHVSVGGSVTLDTAGSYDFKVSNYTYATHVVVDVLGYSVKPMWARIAGDGSLLKGSRVVSASKFSTGAYEVFFDRDVSQCAYHASEFLSNGGGIEVEPRVAQPTAVYVGVLNSSGAFTDGAFYVTVTC